MARSNYRGGTRRAPKDVGRRIKKKPCALCRDSIAHVDYKDISLLRKYMSDRGKIRSRRVTGNCAQHQRGIAVAIKTARELILLPYTQRTVTERPGGRGGRGGPREGRGPGGGDRGGPRGERGERTEATLADTTEEPSDSRDTAVSENEAPDVVASDGGASDEGAADGAAAEAPSEAASSEPEEA
jgi:small subunit ribosomal protein S18